MPAARVRASRRVRFSAIISAVTPARHRKRLLIYDPELLLDEGARGIGERVSRCRCLSAHAQGLDDRQLPINDTVEDIG